MFDALNHCAKATCITNAHDSVDEDSRTNVALNNTISFSSPSKPTPSKSHFFVAPSTTSAREQFFSLHPIQPYAGLSFNSHRLYIRYDDEGEKIDRRWVTYSKEEEKYPDQFV